MPPLDNKSALAGVYLQVLKFWDNFLIWNSNSLFNKSAIRMAKILQNNLLKWVCSRWMTKVLLRAYTCEFWNSEATFYPEAQEVFQVKVSSEMQNSIKLRCPPRVYSRWTTKSLPRSWSWKFWKSMTTFYPEIQSLYNQSAIRI